MNVLRRAMITGVSGQDGALLATALLDAGVQVIGTRRPISTAAAWRLEALGIASHPDLHIAPLDLGDAGAIGYLLDTTRPDAIFHLAGQSSVADAFADPLACLTDNGVHTVNLLDALRRKAPATRLVLAASAEMLAASDASLDESARLAADTPYALSKLLAHAAVGAWRSTWGLHASSAILFNHESEWRGESFVTRRISRGVARIANGGSDPLALGNLDARRDFGYAPDIIAAMLRMAEQPEPGDFVLASGRATSIREFASDAFAAAGTTLVWQGQGLQEVGVDAGSGRPLVVVGAQQLRPVDARVRLGNADKARRRLDFVNTLDAAAIARRMVEADLMREHSEPGHA